MGIRKASQSQVELIDKLLYERVIIGRAQLFLIDHPEGYHPEQLSSRDASRLINLLLDCPKNGRVFLKEDGSPATEKQLAFIKTLLEDRKPTPYLRRVIEEAGGVDGLTKAQAAMLITGLKMCPRARAKQKE